MWVQAHGERLRVLEHRNWEMRAENGANGRPGHVPADGVRQIVRYFT
jgi:hypothetical protein